MNRSSTLVLFGLLLLCSAAKGEPTNLIENGSFEKGVSGWTADAALQRAGVFRAEDDAKRKGRVLSVENRDPNETVGLSQRVSCRTDRFYEISGYARSTPLQEGAGLAVHFLSRDGKLLKRLWVLRIPSWGALSWQHFRTEFHAPKSATAFLLKTVIYMKGRAWFDDLELVEKNRSSRAYMVKGKPLERAGIEVQRFEVGRPLYSLAAADLNRDGQMELLLADIDGRLQCRAEDGKTLWTRNMGGLVFALACGDLDGDGSLEVAACTADREGRLVVLDRKGEVQWAYTQPGNLFHHVAIGDLDNDGKGEVFVTYGNQLVALNGQGKESWRRSFGGPRFYGITTGDLAGDGRNEVAVAVSSRKTFAAAFRPSGHRLWTYSPEGFSRLDAQELVIADVDADGRNEVILACSAGIVFCLRDGKTVWAAPRARAKLRSSHPDVTGQLGSMPSRILVKDFCPERPGLETLVSLVDSVWMLDRNGRLIWETKSGLLNRGMVPGPDKSWFVPSSGFRDPSYYKLSFVRNGSNPLKVYSVPNSISAGLDALYEKVRLLPALPAARKPAGKFHVIYASLLWPFSKYGSLERIRAISDFLETKESENLEFLFMLWPKDLPVELHRGGMMEQEEILKVVRFLEKLGRPFLFFADHGCSPNLSLDTIEKTFQQAPTACRGMYVAENTAHYPSAKWNDFVGWAMRVMDLCLKYGGRKMVFKEMYDTWTFLPADPGARATLLQPKYKDTLVAMYATNNSYAPELQVGGMIGLKQAGLVRYWGISTQYWNWSWGAHRTRQDNYALCPPDVILSMEMSAACLGARWFHIEGGQEYLVRGRAELSPRARRHRDLVYELMRKNVLLPVPDEDNLSFSNLVIERRPSPALEEFRKNELPGSLGSPVTRPLESMRRGLLGINGALQATREDYFPSYAYHSIRYMTAMAPEAPFGFIRIVPESGRAKDFLAGKQPLLTDGRDVFLSGRWIPALKGKKDILAMLEKASSRLPARASVAALYVHRIGKEYRLFLLNSGYMCPEEQNAELQLGTQLRRGKIRDMMTGERVIESGQKLKVTVPAGAFRVLEVLAE